MGSDVGGVGVGGVWERMWGVTQTCSLTTRCVSPSTSFSARSVVAFCSRNACSTRPDSSSPAATRFCFSFIAPCRSSSTSFSSRISFSSRSFRFSSFAASTFFCSIAAVCSVTAASAAAFSPSSVRSFSASSAMIDRACCTCCACASRSRHSSSRVAASSRSRPS